MKNFTLFFITVFLTSIGIGQTSSSGMMASNLPQYSSAANKTEMEVQAVALSDDLNQTELTDFKMKPNPASSKFELTISERNATLKLEVFDVLGKRILHKSISKISTTINVTEWNSGVYLVRLTSDNGTQTKRFIKQ